LDPANELPLGHDELLAQKPILCDEHCPSAEQVGEETCQEPNEIAHVGAL
jgi:hypothetical protein